MSDHLSFAHCNCVAGLIRVPNWLRDRTVGLYGCLFWLLTDDDGLCGTERASLWGIKE